MTTSVAAQVCHAYNTWAPRYDATSSKTHALDAEAMLSHSKNWDFNAKKILEVGCGSGRNTQWLLKEFGSQVESITGMDLSEGMLAKARDKLEPMAYKGKVDLFQHDVLQPWPLGSRSRDLVLENLVLEHLPRLDHFFQEASRVLKNKGTLFLCEYHPCRKYNGGWTNADAGELIDMPPCFQYDISEFVSLAQENGFVLKTLKEWRYSQHSQDYVDKEPRLVTMEFTLVGSNKITDIFH